MNTTESPQTGSITDNTAALENSTPNMTSQTRSPLRVLTQAYAEQQIDRSLYLQLRGNILDYISGDLVKDQEGDLTLPLTSK